MWIIFPHFILNLKVICQIWINLFQLKVRLVVNSSTFYISSFWTHRILPLVITLNEFINFIYESGRVSMPLLFLIFFLVFVLIVTCIIFVSIRFNNAVALSRKNIFLTFLIAFGFNHLVSSNENINLLLTDILLFFL